MFRAANLSGVVHRVEWTYKLNEIWGNYRPIIAVPKASFTFQTRGSSSKLGQETCDWGRKSRPNLALFIPVKFREGVGRMYETLSRFFKIILGAYL